MLHLAIFVIPHMSLKINWDALGIGASLACAIHCAVLPLVLSSLPLFGIDVINNRIFEYFMIALALIVGSHALWHGYKKHHQRLFPLLLFTAGILLLLAKQHWHQYELFILPFAVIFIVSAHGINFRSCRIKNHEHHGIQRTPA